jgi:CRP-like cAMP-binding protein/transcriptional regulator with XRE-family HTH domain
VNRKKTDLRVADVLERIRLLRIAKKISVETLATGANVSRSYIYYIETKKKIPTLTVLVRIADALDVTVEELFCQDSCSSAAIRQAAPGSSCDTPVPSSKLFDFLTFLYANQKKTYESDFLSWKELYILCAVKQTGPCSLRGLSATLAMTTIDISRTVSDLQARNILRKRQKVSDHRVVLLTLTDTGSVLLGKTEREFQTCLESGRHSVPDQNSAGDTFDLIAGNFDRLVCSFKPVFNRDREIADLEISKIHQKVLRQSAEHKTLRCSTLLSRTIYHHFDTVISICNTVWKQKDPVRITLGTGIRGKEYACEFSRTAADYIVISIELIQKKTDEYIQDFFPYYAFLLDSRPAVMVVECATGRILEANESAVRFYGWPRRLLRQKTVYEISTTSAAVLKSRLTAGEDSCSCSGQVFHVSHRFADGNTRQLYLHLSSCLCGKTRIQYAAVMQNVSAGPPFSEQKEPERIENRPPENDFTAFTSKYTNDSEAVNELFRSMKKAGKMYRYSAGDQFFDTGDASLPTFGFVLAGFFRVYYETSSGREYTLEYLRPGDMIDSLTFSSCFSEHEIIVETVAPGRALFIEQSLFKRQAAADPLAFEFLYTLSRKRLETMERHIMLLLTDTAKDRYEQFLHEEAAVTGCLRGQEFAAYLGITPETLSRIRNTK